MTIEKYFQNRVWATNFAPGGGPAVIESEPPSTNVKDGAVALTSTFRNPPLHHLLGERSVQLFVFIEGWGG
jgi:hypothetical protein